LQKARVEKFVDRCTLEAQFTLAVGANYGECEETEYGLDATEEICGAKLLSQRTRMAGAPKGYLQRWTNLFPGDSFSPRLLLDVPRASSLHSAAACRSERSMLLDV
jgi:hypothetical protein